jgi:hypothetical protein
MGRGNWCAIVVGVIVSWRASAALGQLQEQSPGERPALEATPSSSTDAASTAAPAANSPTGASTRPKEKLARIWANEPPLVRLARDKFGDDLTETDAKFFAAVANNELLDLRPASEMSFDVEDPASWAECPVLKADRIAWLCSDAAAVKLVPSHGVWLRGASISGRINLYRANVPFPLTFYECLLDNGVNLGHAKLQELDCTNCCSARIDARGAQVAENVYLMRTCVYGGIDFIEAQITGDFDMNGGRVSHCLPGEEQSPGVAINLFDAKVGGDIKLGEKFRSQGSVHMIGAQIGRSIDCTNGHFAGAGKTAIEARRCQVGSNVSFDGGFVAEGGIEMRGTRIGGDFDCDGGRFIASEVEALSADMVNVAGQVLMGDGFHAEGEVRLINATVKGDVDCDNGHFLHSDGDALSLDSSTIESCLRIGYESSAEAVEPDGDLSPGFVAQGTVRLFNTQVNQEVLASGGVFDAPLGTAILANNLRVGSRVLLSGITANGTVQLLSADIEHDLDLRGSHFDGTKAPGKIAIWGNGMQVRGHVYSNQIDTPDKTWPFRVDGLMSLQFATIKMHWDLYGAQLVNPGGDALDASDCRVGGYVNLDTVAIDGRASFSRAKIDGMWIINKVIGPEKMLLDMRFAHIWVIKDEKLADWPTAGHLQLEGLVYDHFDDDSPLSVTERLAWLRRQYAPNDADARRGSQHVRRGSPDPAESADRKSPSRDVEETVRGQETLAQHGVLETRAQNGAAKNRPQPIVAADFEAPAMPAPPVVTPPPPMMARPSEAIPPAMTVPPPHNENASAAPNVEEPDASSIGAPDTTEAAAAETDDAASASTAKPADEPVAAPDPSSRRYITQPYTQLAAVYRAIGQDEEANTVLVARAERIGELASPFSPQGLWYRYFGRLIGYGYEPFRAIKIGVAIIAVGALVFAIGAHRNLMAETKLAESVLPREGELGRVSPSYPRFNPLVYSLEVFIPFVNLNQVCYWIPGEKPSNQSQSRNCLMHVGPYSLKWSTALNGYLWFQTLAGWTLCTLLAAAVTGIVES